MGSLRKILAFLAPYKGLIIAASVLTGSLTLIGMAPPLLMRTLVNDVAREGKWGLLPLIITLLFAVPLLRALVNIANSVALNKVGLGIIAKTRKRMFERLMRLSMRFYNEMPVGGINQRLMGDVASVSGVVGGGIIALLTDVIAVAFAVAVMLSLSWSLSLLTFALLPLYFLNYKLFSKRIQQANAQLRTQMDHISSMLQERLSAHELIQAYGQEKAEATQFSSQAKQVMDAAVRGSSYSISFNQLSAFINKLCNTAIYCAGCYYFVKGSMGYGDVIAFCAYATQLLGPVVRFSTVANQLAQVGVSVDRIEQILGREPAIKELADAAAVETLQGSIRLDGVTVTYGEAGAALTDVHLEVPAASHVAIVGPPGSGRTTLAMLLRRFYDPGEGRVEVDGKDIREYRLRDYRRALALVPPEAAIFDGTVRENICYGKPDAAEERMAEVCKTIGLHDFVAGLADGYDTRVGTGGLKLSAGVQQQVGIARALLAEPLILIVDEATASLDPDSAETVNQAVRGEMKGRTCILIVHRVLVARDADTIVVLDNGQIVETGSHDELIRVPEGLYRLIFAKQYGEAQLPPAEEGA